MEMPLQQGEYKFTNRNELDIFIGCDKFWSKITWSGDCEKVIEKDGKLYSHIINPKLDRLLEINGETLAQAVVVCKGSCMFADALSTVSKGDVIDYFIFIATHQALLGGYFIRRPSKGPRATWTLSDSI